MEVFIGTIVPFGFNYAPLDWALCQGQTLPLQQYSALAALLGTQYGGDGRTTVGLPNLQGRMAVGMGRNAVTGTTYNMGASNGAEGVRLSIANMPTHTHPAAVTPGGTSTLTTATLNAVNTIANLTTATGNLLGAAHPANQQYAPAGTATTPMATPGAITVTNTGGAVTLPTVAVGTAGTGTATLSVMQPVQTVSYCIALFGIYPPRP